MTARRHDPAGCSHCGLITTFSNRSNPPSSILEPLKLNRYITYIRLALVTKQGHSDMLLSAGETLASPASPTGHSDTHDEAGSTAPHCPVTTGSVTDMWRRSVTPAQRFNRKPLMTEADMRHTKTVYGSHS